MRLLFAFDFFLRPFFAVRNRLSRRPVSKSSLLLITSLRNTGKALSSKISPSMFDKINWLSGLRNLSSMLSISCATLRLNTFISPLLNPRSIEMGDLSFSFCGLMISTDPVRINSSITARTGRPPPCRLTSVSNVGPCPKILRSAGRPLRFVKFGCSFQTERILFIECGRCPIASWPPIFFDLRILDTSARGIPVMAAIPEMLRRRLLTFWRSAATLTAATRHISCNSRALKPTSTANPVKGTKIVEIAARAAIRTSGSFNSPPHEHPSNYYSI